MIFLSRFSLILSRVQLYITWGPVLLSLIKSLNNDACFSSKYMKHGEHYKSTWTIFTSSEHLAIDLNNPLKPALTTELSLNYDIPYDSV